MWIIIQNNDYETIESTGRLKQYITRFLSKKTEHPFLAKINTLL